MTRRRRKHKSVLPRTSASALPREVPEQQRVVARQAEIVVRMAYSRTQAAQALGISRSTFNRRVLPFVATIEVGLGTRLIPVDELERYAAEHRAEARERVRVQPRAGRRSRVSVETIQRIRQESAAGASLGAIARGLNADGVPTGQGGRRWWPSSVRSVLARSGIERSP
jgi:hypothetical protein